MDWVNPSPSFGCIAVARALLCTASNQKQSHPADDLQSLKQVRLHGLDKSFVCINIILLGKGGATKSDEFSEKCQRGVGSFSIQKFMLQILGTLNRAF